jgi:hypothetical protein
MRTSGTATATRLLILSAMVTFSACDVPPDAEFGLESTDDAELAIASSALTFPNNQPQPSNTKQHYIVRPGGGAGVVVGAAHGAMPVLKSGSSSKHVLRNERLIEVRSGLCWNFAGPDLPPRLGACAGPNAAWFTNAAGHIRPRARPGYCLQSMGLDQRVVTKPCSAAGTQVWGWAPVTEPYSCYQSATVSCQYPPSGCASLAQSGTQCTCYYWSTCYRQAD